MLQKIYCFYLQHYFQYYKYNLKENPFKIYFKKVLVILDRISELYPSENLK